MGNLQAIAFFSENIESSIFECLIPKRAPIKIFLTGEALTSLYDQNQIGQWQSLLDYSAHRIYLIIDKKELQLMGLTQEGLEKLYPKAIYEKSMEITTEFWEKLLKILVSLNPTDQLAFFQMHGPYMDRTTVYMLRFLENGLKHQLSTWLFNYLDGIHNGHAHQRPSEFENIGESLRKLQATSNFEILTCSRCATARGYWYKDPEGNITEYDTIPYLGIQNLNAIISQFEVGYPIISSTWIASFETQPGKSEARKSLEKKTSLIIFITHPPYSKEWTFGGLSFAVAAANHEIDTKVVFIGKGVFCVQGNHDILETDRVFNIQEIVFGTMDMDFLEYSIFQPSVTRFNITIGDDLEEIPLINGEDLAKIMTPREAQREQEQNRKGLNYQAYFF